MKPQLKILKGIETLRSYLVSKKQVDELIEEPPGDPTDDEKDAMENFKKIFHFGKDQLEGFVSFISGGGKSLNEYSILYFITQLKNSPFYRIVKDLTNNFKAPFWRNPPDIMGVASNENRSDLQTEASQLGLDGGDIAPSKEAKCGASLGVRSNYNNVTRHKVPYHVERNIYNITVLAGDIHSTNLTGLTDYDVYMSNKPGSKPTSSDAHGTYRVADSKSWEAIQGSRNNVKGVLGEDYGIYEYNKLVNPYNKKCSDPTRNEAVIRKVPYVKNDGSYNHPEGEVKVDKTVETDLTGELYTFDDYREYTVKIPLSAFHEEVVQKEYVLHEFLGQFGEGKEPKKDPINS
jgi:hypothetical protein